MTLAERLIPKLQERFGDVLFTVTGTAQPCVVFPPVHPEVGPIEIHDDDSELTVVAGNFTHGHFSNYDDDLSDEEKDIAIVDAVIDFLDAVFADQVVFWGSHESGGGWSHRATPDAGQSVWPWPIERVKQSSKQFVWSGPLSADTQDK